MPINFVTVKPVTLAKKTAISRHLVENEYLYNAVYVEICCTSSHTFLENRFCLSLISRFAQKFIYYVYCILNFQLSHSSFSQLTETDKSTNWRLNVLTFKESKISYVEYFMNLPEQLIVYK